MEFENINEIIQFAIGKEEEAAQFYEGLSREERFSGKKEMFIDFSREERKHKKLLEGMLTGDLEENLEEYRFKWITDIKRSDYVDDIEYEPGMGYQDILMLAAKREEKALQLYNDLQEKTETESAVKIFKVLCQEEAKHKLALETMYDDYMAEMGD
jgi:rubrerythrin